MQVLVKNVVMIMDNKAEMQLLNLYGRKIYVRVAVLLQLNHKSDYFYWLQFFVTLFYKQVEIQYPLKTKIQILKNH
jgi:hypothetical protein